MYELNCNASINICNIIFFPPPTGLWRFNASGCPVPFSAATNYKVLISTKAKHNYTADHSALSFLPPTGVCFNFKSNFNVPWREVKCYRTCTHGTPSYLDIVFNVGARQVIFVTAAMCPEAISTHYFLLMLICQSL